MNSKGWIIGVQDIRDYVTRYWRFDDADEIEIVHEGALLLRLKRDVLNMLARTRMLEPRVIVKARR